MMDAKKALGRIGRKHPLSRDNLDRAQVDNLEQCQGEPDRKAPPPEIKCQGVV